MYETMFTVKNAENYLEEINQKNLKKKQCLVRVHKQPQIFPIVLNPLPREQILKI